MDKWRGSIRQELTKAEYHEQVMMWDFPLLLSTQEQKRLRVKVQEERRRFEDREGMKDPRQWESNWTIEMPWNLSWVRRKWGEEGQYSEKVAGSMEANGSEELLGQENYKEID